MKLAAQMQSIGMDGMKFLTSTDPMYMITASAVHRKARLELDRRDEQLSNRIANAVGRLFKK